MLTKANEGNPDAIFLGAADTACAPAMKTAHDLGITAKLYLVGACAAPGIVEQIGEDAVDGRIFNIEGPVTGQRSRGRRSTSPCSAGTAIRALEGASAATVSFRGTMNLYAVAGRARPRRRLARRRCSTWCGPTRNRPSFDGHAYTCDGEQVPDLPALCAPQQILVVAQRRDARPDHRLDRRTRHPQRAGSTRAERSR